MDRYALAVFDWNTQRLIHYLRVVNQPPTQKKSIPIAKKKNPPMDSLPLELLSKITKDLDRDGLRTLRGMSTRLSAVATPGFFRVVSFNRSQRSMGAMLALQDCPGVM